MASFSPGYLATFKDGGLAAKVNAAVKMLKSCTLCPRECKINRLDGEHGVCQTGARAKVSSYNAHFGEEAPLVGQHGSGTIFFTHCNLMCNFCQNYDISHEGFGEEIDDKRLSAIMLALQTAGCHNINFVTPSHVVPQILSATLLAVKAGLRIPLVYNSSGYDSLTTLQLLEGVIDIYMPDFKFWDPQVAKITCDAEDYPEIARVSLAEMHRQVGDLNIDESGVAHRGLLVRHLVLPDGLAGTPNIMHYIARHISTNSYVNVMAQYRPCGRASEVKALSRSISDQEYQAAVRCAKEAGIMRLDQPRRVFRWL